ncbi:hypothetical protein BB737_06610 [Mycobacterium avium subsp. hominissuis]|uniref:Uncharacterized protein n=2 Tax=Mycobacterium avium complex (MAC) TaxID=120793 RepID=A0A2A3L4W3_MYCAV|nr:hypothetical protein BST19_19825 [Mycobacterium bouchedurhonense]PBJ31896.1 hypothetical protein XV03_18765 [Mycobacterium avium subsp. hominissuis]PBJ66636.1 hypothetical protein BB737_06610 [Mycobacterium avium subsp. hominissuis]
MIIFQPADRGAEHLIKHRAAVVAKPGNDDAAHPGHIDHALPAAFRLEAMFTVVSEVYSQHIDALDVAVGQDADRCRRRRARNFPRFGGHVLLDVIGAPLRPGACVGDEIV